MSFKAESNLSGIRELKLGKTFDKFYKNDAYHTIRYDFKPASVDSQKTGSLDVVDKEVTLSVPLVAGAGSSQEAIFKGNKTSASKDCLLIIDNSTGEVVLERISENIRLKKTRTEASSKKMLNRMPDAKITKSHQEPFGGTNVPPPRPSKPLSAQQPTKKSSAHAPGSMPLLGFEEQKNQESDSSSDSESNSGSSSSSSDSDSDSDTEMKVPDSHHLPASNAQVHSDRNSTHHKSILSDLDLSEED